MQPHVKIVLKNTEDLNRCVLVTAFNETLIEAMIAWITASSRENDRVTYIEYDEDGTERCVQTLHHIDGRLQVGVVNGLLPPWHGFNTVPR